MQQRHPVLVADLVEDVVPLVAVADLEDLVDVEAVAVAAVAVVVTAVGTVVGWVVGLVVAGGMVNAVILEEVVEQVGRQVAVLAQVGVMWNLEVAVTVSQDPTQAATPLPRAAGHLLKVAVAVQIFPLPKVVIVGAKVNLLHP